MGNVNLALNLEDALHAERDDFEDLTEFDLLGDDEQNAIEDDYLIKTFFNEEC